MEKQNLSIDSSDQPKEKDISELVWDVADSILKSGRYPTRNDICKELRKSPKTIGRYFAEWKEANPKSTSMVRNKDTDVIESNGGHHRGKRSVASRSTLPSREEEVQYNVARDIAAERYYKKTWNFTVPGLREDLEEALAEIDEHSRRQDETLNPLGMVDYLLKRDYPSS